nr:ankyrin repeat protein SKIP35 [Ipomoea batatas]
MKEEKRPFVVETQDLNLGGGVNIVESHCSEMDVETGETGVSSLTDQIVVFNSENGEGSNRNVVFSREAPLAGKDFRASTGAGGACSCGAKKLKFRTKTSDSETGKDDKPGQEKKLSRQDRIELGRLFQGAVSSHDWDLAESLIFPQTLNDALCIALDSIWFLSTHQELYGITGLIKKIISNGAKVQKFTEWALKCIGFHSRCQGITLQERTSLKPLMQPAFLLLYSLAHLILVGRLVYQQLLYRDC